MCDFPWEAFPVCLRQGGHQQIKENFIQALLVEPSNVLGLRISMGDLGNGIPPKS